MTETLLDQIEKRVKEALTFNENAEVAPVALLWPDRDRHFVDAVVMLRLRMPILTLGALDEAARIGPAYWLRCAIARTVEVELGDGPPLVYLPGVGSEDLRAIEQCPRELAPIAELQYRGEWFSHPNGKDWTVPALLANRERGLGLQVAEGTATREALIGAFAELLELPMRRLRDYIDAKFLDRVLNPDPVARMLEWLDDPTGFRERMDEVRWKAFCEHAKREYDLHPAADGEVTGGRRLGERQGAWAGVWKRFAEAPELYSGVEERLRKGRPDDVLPFAPAGTWPQDNEQAERELRKALWGLEGATASQARQRILELWQEHAERRHWVWAKLERSPLVLALEQLHRVASGTTDGVKDTVEELVADYAYAGWQVDDAFVAALASVEGDDREAVAAAAKAPYVPWLDAHTKAFQEAIRPLAKSGAYVPGPEASTEDGTVTVFVDGLRLDQGNRLTDSLGNFEVAVETTLAALPSVTQTVKPVLTPLPAGSLEGGSDLVPTRTGKGTKATIAVLRSLMKERGLQVLQGSETGDPAGCAWTETGDVDRRGHESGVAFVDEIHAELDRIARRVTALLDAGWKQVDVIADHGWLFVPGGLAKTELPAAVVEIKKGRCARLKDGASTSLPVVPWHWDANVRIALAPGITCFEANQQYEHGGASLQECVVPRLRVRPGATTTTVTGGATITEVKWLGLMCRIMYENVAQGATVDIRVAPSDPKTSVGEKSKEATGDGRLALHVTDDELEGSPAFVVIVGADSALLAQREVTIGVNR